MNSPNNNSIFLSVVIPLYNEENNISVLLQNLSENIKPLNVTYEIILVDDGSSDHTWKRIKLTSNKDKHIKGIQLARNFGHQHALLAGLKNCKGQVSISMDGDMQHPPNLISDMLNEHRKGVMVVNTCRDDIKVASFFKRKTSSWFYKIFSLLTNVSMAEGSSDFRLLDRKVLDHLLTFNDVDIFLRGAVEWIGFPSVTLHYKANQRYSGESKFSLSKMIKFARGSIISFSTKPLIIGIWLGIFTSSIAFLEIIYILYQVLFSNPVQGWSSIIGIISFLFGVLFIILGIIGTYLARIHVALQNRPRFIINEITNAD